MLRITLPPEDRERLGAPEVIEIDLNRPTLGQIRALHEQVGWSWEQFVETVHGRREGDRAYAAGILYWLAARSAGVTTPWAEFDLDFLGVEPVHEPEGNQQAPSDGA